MLSEVVEAVLLALVVMLLAVAEDRLGRHLERKLTLVLNERGRDGRQRRSKCRRKRPLNISPQLCLIVFVVFVNL